ncbi:MAG: hypothetical protein Q8P07_01200 [bacterium]|nr:hypothetical protein [bacterium]
MENYADLGKIRKFCTALPKPQSLYRYKNDTIRIYAAKKLFSPKWTSPAVHGIVREARKSYYRYGTRSLWDPYDKKAAVYLARVSYSLNGNPVEEWLSIRIVPGGGSPKGVGEPEIYSYKNRPLVEYIKHKLFRGNVNFWAQIISGSRMCGVQPYFLTNNGPFTYVLRTKHRHSDICFALIFRRFALDYDKNDYKYISGIIADRIVSAVSFKKGRKILKPFFMPANVGLGVKKGDIKLNRNIYSYKFPIYWLNNGELIKLLNKLVKTKILSKESIKRTGACVPIKNTKELKDIGKLLTARGHIIGSKLTGKELRNMIDASVQNAAELKFTPVKDWNLGIKKILKAADARLSEAKVN